MREYGPPVQYFCMTESNVGTKVIELNVGIQVIFFICMIWLRILRAFRFDELMTLFSLEK